MYITKAIIFNKKDLPLFQREINKCTECNVPSLLYYCGYCGKQNELIKSDKKEQINVYDFLNKYDLLRHLSISINTNKVCIFVNCLDNHKFISLTEISGFIDEGDFENREDVKKLLNTLKEYNISFIRDVVVVC